MKTSRRLLTIIGLATIFVGTPACEMQKAEVTMKKYAKEKKPEAEKVEQPDPADSSPPTYFKE